jgi:hypothetical protein
VVFGDPHKTRPAPNDHDPIGTVLTNSVIGLYNLGNRVFGNPRQDPYFAPTTPQQAEEMQQVELAAVFVPGLDVDELVAQLASGVKPVAEGAELQSVIDRLYQIGDQLPGGTAGAVRAERTGIKVGGKVHLTKAGERARQLTKMIAKGQLSGRDLALARAIVIDLMNAVTGK